tara:strand:+ start:2110 stop:2556 length:447 start_codon:yes stop_codon:yes gene_type:complete
MTYQSIEKILLNRKLPLLEPLFLYKDSLKTDINNLNSSDLIKSALHLLNDDLYSSHKLSQKILSKEGSYLHAIMHRREGDYSNSKYWCNQIGNHQIWETMSRNFDEWDPFSFIDWCQKASKGHNKKPINYLQRIQFKELSLLLDCFNN